jgi:hypothetical protein
MSTIVSLFDYIHYRIYQFFKERGDNVPEWKGTLILSLMQSFTVIDVMVIVKIIHDYSFPSKFAFLPLLIVAGAINWYRYERNFDGEKLENRWKDEATQVRKRNGWFIGLYLLASFLIPAAYGYLKHNLNVI